MNTVKKSSTANTPMNTYISMSVWLAITPFVPKFKDLVTQQWLKQKYVYVLYTLIMTCLIQPSSTPRELQVDGYDLYDLPVGNSAGTTIVSPATSEGTIHV